ncbi:MAG: DNA-binding protein [Bacilli bacterium]|nr:DNA-binding protein [Bacilli bacterium]
MEDIVYYNELYDLYGELLTDKQRKYFEDYYFHNLSFSEMAENYNVSRNAAFKQIHIVLDKLEEYERILQLKKKREKIRDLVKDADLLKKIEDIL